MRKQTIGTNTYYKQSGVGRLLLQIAGPVLVAILSWYVTQWLLFESELLTIKELYQIGFPTAISEELMVYIVALVVFLLINIVVMTGYFIALPSGRRRAGSRDSYSQYSNF